MMTNLMNLEMIIIQNDSYLVVNYINGKINVPKKIVNLMKYRDTDAMTKGTCLLCISFIFLC